MSIVLRIAKLVAVGIFLQTLFFKFTAHPESVQIFTSLGIEPRGRLLTGILELIASLVLLFGGKKSRIGGLLGLIVMLGAFVAHGTVLGINTLFFLAVVTFLACATVIRIQRQEMLQTIRQRRFRTQLIVTVVLLLMYLTNYLGTSGALGLPMTQLAELFPFPYMPPGWTFGIARGAIYLMLGVFVVIGRTEKGRQSSLYQYLLPWFIVTCILNMLRLFLTGAGAYAFSVLVIAALRVVLGKIVATIAKLPLTKTREHRTIALPRGCYYGRVSLAAGMIALSQTVYLNARLLPLTKERTILILALGLTITIGSFRKRRNRGQLLISVLAFAGITVSLITYFS